MMTSHFISVAGLALLLAGCDAVPLPSEPEAEAPKPIRGLVTTLVQNTGDSTVRRYPGVLEPSEITSLSFEVAGRLGKIDLSVGQRIDEGTVLARLDSEQFEVTIENRKASVVEAEATVTQEADDLSRQEKLRESGTVSRVTVDNARADLKRAEAQLVQAQKNLASAEEDLTETVLQAPFSGIINSVDVDSFATVAVGTTVTSLYDASSYEVSFSVNFDTVSQMVVGTPATIRLADDPDVTLNAVISELGERADTVSSFPVTVALSEDHPLIKAGMAVEVSFEFQIPAQQGFLIPISAAIPEGQIPPDAGPNKPIPVDMYIFDPQTETVTRRTVVMAGLRENKFLIIEGLEAGDRVATAGVSFLREGMKVKLLETGS